MSMNNDEEPVDSDVNVCKETQRDEFTKPTEFTDIILNVEGKQLHAVRFVLITSSPVFKTMITSSHFKESNADQIDFPTESFRNMQLLLKYLHPGVGALTADASERLLPLTDKYQIEGLKERCTNYLCSNLKKVPDDRLVSLLTLTEQLGMDKLKEQCVKLLMKMPIKELVYCIGQAVPKSTVTWQIVGQILEPRVEQISSLTRFREQIKYLSEKHMDCDRHRDEGGCHVELYDDDFGSYYDGNNWNKTCLKEFASHIVTLLNLK